jgi:hypothetical protein
MKRTIGSSVAMLSTDILKNVGANRECQAFAFLPQLSNPAWVCVCGLGEPNGHASRAAWAPVE